MIAQSSSIQRSSPSESLKGWKHLIEEQWPRSSNESYLFHLAYRDVRKSLSVPNFAVIRRKGDVSAYPSVAARRGQTI